MKSCALILILTLCFTTTCLAQSYYDKLDSTINQDINRLKAKGIDTICVYWQYCVGCFIPIGKHGDTICRHQPYEYDTYFLWKHKGITNMTMKNLCFSYDTISIKATELWKFYFANRYKISREKLKPFQSVFYDHGKRRVFPTVVDHSEKEDITLITATEQKKLYLDEFQFQKYEKDIGEGENISYTYNWNTQTKRLQVLLDELVHINFGKLKKLK